MSAQASSPPPAWRCRFYREGDDQSILDVLQDAFGKWPAVDIDVPPIEHLRWKLNSHALALQLHEVAEIDGEIASPRILIVQPVRFQGQRSLSFQPVDIAVAPRFRGLGISERHMNEEWRLMKEDKRYRQTFSLKLYIRGWHPATRRIRARIRVNGHAFGNRFIALARPNSAPARSDEDTPYVLRDVPSFDERIDAFWEEASRPFTFSVDRTRDYLNWRYGRRAGVFTTTLAEQDGRVLGYVVSRASRGIGYITDLIALPERLDIARSLANAALTALARQDVATVECWLPTRHPYGPVLRDLGFVRSERKLRFRYGPVGLSSAQLELLRGFDTPLHITAGDTDLV